jgi:hypothetical protein
LDGMHWNIHYIIPRFGTAVVQYRLLASGLVGVYVSAHRLRLSALVSSPSASRSRMQGKFRDPFSEIGEAGSRGSSYSVVMRVTARLDDGRSEQSEGVGSRRGQGREGGWVIISREWSLSRGLAIEAARRITNGRTWFTILVELGRWQIIKAERYPDPRFTST